jgi:hypothetical protein
MSNTTSYHITPFEVMLYIWLASFAYEELGEFIDAGSIFYAVDIWNGCDLFIILIGAVFLVTSKQCSGPSAGKMGPNNYFRDNWTCER